MKAFTYGQYIKCIHTLRLNAVLQLAEESTEYNLKILEEKDTQDKTIKNILQDKKQVAKLLNQFLQPKEKIKAEELMLYTSKKYKLKEADVIYCLKRQNIFFLLEHQTTIDTGMPYRMLNYCLEIMQEGIRNKKMKQGYPVIVPIVVYTGKQRWKMTNHPMLKKSKIQLEYNLIDMNKLSNKFSPC